jgi:hypothetical protein
MTCINFLKEPSFRGHMYNFPNGTSTVVVGTWEYLAFDGHHHLPLQGMSYFSPPLGIVTFLDAPPSLVGNIVSFPLPRHTLHSLMR